jgi:riboflavin synthase
LINLGVQAASLPKTMFTGLVETIGRIKSVSAGSVGQSFQISCCFEGERLRLGESISVDGVCVTVEQFDEAGFRFSASPETLRRSTLPQNQAADHVHLERALRLGDRLGGHIVQGHVDGVGKIRRFVSQQEHGDLSIEIPPDLLRYAVEKGSLAVQGVSLTIAGLESGLATCALIPETLRRTYLGSLKAGDRVNLEVDILAKYVESLMQNGKGGISPDQLAKWGFA